MAGHNFGTGSSREHAVWALMDYGFEAVVSSRFADIFRNNSIKQGLLPVQVTPAFDAELMRAVEADPTLEITIDVARGTIEAPAAGLAAELPAGRVHPAAVAQRVGRHRAVTASRRGHHRSRGAAAELSALGLSRLASEVVSRPAVDLSDGPVSRNEREIECGDPSRREVVDRRHGIEGSQAGGQTAGCGGVPSAAVGETERGLLRN